MADPFLAEIRIVGFDFAPSQWALCNGQIMAISQNTALFSLIGTYYGGNGMTTFALPNLQGRAPLGVGGGPGLTVRSLGETGGTNTHTLTGSELPAHTHQAMAKVDRGNTLSPAGAVWATERQERTRHFSTATPSATVGDITPAGGSQAHDNMQPYLAVNFIIALWGIYPPRP